MKRVTNVVMLDNWTVRLEWTLVANGEEFTGGSLRKVAQAVESQGLYDSSLVLYPGICQVK